MKIFKSESWQNYISMDYMEVEKNLKNYLKKQKIDGKWLKPRASFLLGSRSESNVFIASQENGFSIEIYKATADPITRLFLGFTNGERHFTGVTYIKISPINQQAKPIIRQLLSALSTKAQAKPWDVAKHPRFKNAWLMRYLIKKRWQQLV